MSAERDISPRTESLLDHYMPEYDKSEHHSISIDAPPDATYQALLSAPIGSSIRVQVLLRLREFPSRLSGRHCDDDVNPRTASVLDLVGNGFFLVDEQPGREIILGKLGQFWRPRGGSAPKYETIDAPLEPGTAAALWNFRVARNGAGSVVHTETRIRCADDSARRSFSRYWFLIAPFSGFIRKQMLKSIRDAAESIGY
ncbi:MAG: hypothetical protein M3Z17_01050 [Gemmatimonadota bacterium]|nr:hypothetical protein [Gemmatimonadota bacterium]